MRVAAEFASTSALTWQSYFARRYPRRWTRRRDRSVWHCADGDNLAVLHSVVSPLCIRTSRGDERLHSKLVYHRAFEDQRKRPCSIFRSPPRRMSNFAQFGGVVLANEDRTAEQPRPLD